MNIGSEFDKQPWAARLLRRGPNFKRMCEHAANSPYSNIIETGTAWDPDNFEGQGQSTLVWDWLLNQIDTVKCISVDIREEASNYAREHASKVEFLIGDSPKVLNSLPFKTLQSCSVLYLDSFDWTPELNLQSSLHHLGELTSVWALLPKGCLICVDDRHGNGKGKHVLVESYMTCLGYTPVFKNCQIGWIK